MPSSLMVFDLLLTGAPRTADCALPLLVCRLCRWLRPFRTPPHRLNLQSEQIRFHMAKPRTAEAAQLLALHSQNVHILPDNLAADWLEQKPYQWRNSAETKGN